MLTATWCVCPIRPISVDSLLVQKPNSCTYNFVEVSGHNLESSQTWGFRIQCLHHKPISNHFCWGEGAEVVVGGEWDKSDDGEKAWSSINQSILSAMFPVCLYTLLPMSYMPLPLQYCRWALRVDPFVCNEGHATIQNTVSLRDFLSTHTDEWNSANLVLRRRNSGVLNLLVISFMKVTQSLIPSFICSFRNSFIKSCWVLQSGIYKVHTCTMVHSFIYLFIL